MKILFSVISLTAITWFSPAQSIDSYWSVFPDKPDSFQVGSTDPHIRFIVDARNAYLSVDYDDPDYGYEHSGNMEFVYFLTLRKKKIFAFSTFFDGPSSISTSIAFYTFDGEHWREVEVLPTLMLEDFGASEEVAERIRSVYRTHYQLPQHGTDVIATIHPVGENDVSFEYREYIELIRALKTITLRWNREAERFEISTE